MDLVCKSNIKQFSKFLSQILFYTVLLYGDPPPLILIHFFLLSKFYHAMVYFFCFGPQMPAFTYIFFALGMDGL